MKKILATVALGCALSSAYASACATKIGGFYAGISGGLTNFAGKLNGSMTDGNPLNGVNNFKNSVAKNAGNFGVFAGYGMDYNCFWGAVEAFYQYDQIKDQTQAEFINFTNTKDTTIKSNGAWGAAVHLGYMPQKNYTLYAILGLEARRFKGNFVDNVNPKDLQVSINQSYNSIAFAPGFGVRVAVAPNFSVRAQYTYAMHRNKNFSNSQVVGGENQNINFKFSPTVQSFNVGFIYNF